MANEGRRAFEAFGYLVLECFDKRLLFDFEYGLNSLPRLPLLNRENYHGTKGRVAIYREVVWKINMTGGEIAEATSSHYYPLLRRIVGSSRLLESLCSRVFNIRSDSKRGRTG